MQSRIFKGSLAPVLAFALLGVAALPAHAAMTDGSSSAGMEISGATLTANTLDASLATGVEASSSLLADAGSTSSSGDAYLLFAQALTQPATNRQAQVGTQIVGYVTSFGPINRTAEDGGSPTPVPLPAGVWLLLSGVAVLRKTGSNRFIGKAVSV